MEKGTKHSSKTRGLMSIKAKNRNPNHLGKKHSKETKEKMRLAKLGKKRKSFSKETKEKMKKNHVGMKGKHHSKETRLNMSSFRKGIPKSEEFKETMRGSKNPMYGKPSPHGKGDWYIKKSGKRIWMRSTWEIKFANYLDKNELYWEYEPKRFYFENLTYTPDFYIYEWDKWIEIKGFMDNISKLKLECLKDKFRTDYDKLEVYDYNKLKKLNIL